MKMAEERENIPLAGNKSKLKKLEEIAQAIILPITTIGVPIAVGLTVGMYLYKDAIGISEPHSIADAMVIGLLAAAG